MKTVCKKLLCLMLVAMMLVSAVPFAFATEAGYAKVPVQVIFEAENGDETYKDNQVYDNLTSIGSILNAFQVDMSLYNIKKYDIQKEGGSIIGYSDETIDLDGATKVYIRVVRDASVCDHSDTSKYTTTNTATCGKDGVKTVKCACGEVISTEDVAATGNHNFSGASCTVCGASRDAIDTITFYFLDSDGNETSAVRYVYEDGDHITPPTVPANPKSGFSYWAANANGGGMSIAQDETLVYNSQTPNEFHAIYNGKSKMSELKIYAVRYVNGDRKEAHYLYSEYFTTGNTNNMYQYLWDNRDDIRTAAIDELGAGYVWNEKFYDYFTDETLSNANMKDNGNKSVYIKMNTTNANEARVMLYVHKSKTSVVADILEMNGYNAGEKVYINEVKSFLKDEGYKWSSISSLYTDEEWDDLLDGEKPSGSNSINVTDNGTHIIHVVLTGASNSKADSTNPKTGDNIMIAATTMALAAAALVSMYELKKRNMI